MINNSRTPLIACFVGLAVVTGAACQAADLAILAITDGTHTVRLVRDSREVQALISRQSSLEAVDRVESDRFAEDHIRLLREKERKQASGFDVSSIERQLDLQRKHPEAYIPERIAFLKQMGQAVGFVVPPGSNCTIIERSEAICSESPLSNPRYVKVIITSGPLKGMAGWGCEGDGIARTVIMP
jgi:hypothetical protein